MGEWLQQNTEPLQRGDFVGPNDDVIIGADIPAVGLQGVPPVVVHYQPELDAMLRAEAKTRGSIVLWGHTVTHIEDDGKKVVTTLDSGETIESRWFVGCDGASSWTRKFIGLQLEDLRFDQEWLVVDAELHEGAVVDLPVGVRQFCHTDRPFTFVQGVRRYRRWEFQVQDGEDASVLDTEQGLWQLLDGMISPATARIVRSAVYRFHAVVAPVMQHGNIFLAGDSAHQTPPFAGQGLNSGMRDAINLAWKFSFITRGVSTEKILDTYSPERVPHVRSTIAHAVDMGRLIDQLGGRISHGVDVESGYGGTRPSPFIENGIVVGKDARVGHQFWFSPEVSKAVRAGGASFVLVTASPVNIPAAFGTIPVVNVVAPEALGDAFAIVVRPDRYVAAVAGDMAELNECAANLATYV